MMIVDAGFRRDRITMVTVTREETPTGYFEIKQPGIDVFVSIKPNVVRVRDMNGQWVSSQVTYTVKFQGNPQITFGRTEFLWGDRTLRPNKVPYRPPNNVWETYVDCDDVTVEQQNPSESGS